MPHLLQDGTAVGAVENAGSDDNGGPLCICQGIGKAAALGQGCQCISALSQVLVGVGQVGLRANHCQPGAIQPCLSEPASGNADFVTPT